MSEVNAGEICRRRCSTPHVIGGASIPRGIFRTSPASFKPMPIAGSRLSSTPDARRRRPRPPSAGRTGAEHSSNWPISPRTRGEDGLRLRSRPSQLEAVRRIDQLFEIEREIHGLSAEERLRVRQDRSAPLLTVSRLMSYCPSFHLASSKVPAAQQVFHRARSRMVRGKPQQAAAQRSGLQQTALPTLSCKQTTRTSVRVRSGRSRPERTWKKS
jgi:hypothetical protein